MMSSQQAPAVIRNHLLLTAGLAVWGSVSPCPGRLAERLRSRDEGWLRVRDAEIRCLPGPDLRSTTDEVRVPLAGLLFAHEFVSLRGDPHYRGSAANRPTERARLLFSGLPGVWVEGRLASDALEREGLFLTLLEPRATLVSEAATDHAGLLAGLPYLLVNREHVEAVLLLGEDQDREGETTP